METLYQDLKKLKTRNGKLLKDLQKYFQSVSKTSKTRTLTKKNELKIKQLQQLLPLSLQLLETLSQEKTKRSKYEEKLDFLFSFLKYLFQILEAHFLNLTRNKKKTNEKEKEKEKSRTIFENHYLFCWYLHHFSQYNKAHKQLKLLLSQLSEYCEEGSTKIFLPKKGLSSQLTKLVIKCNNLLVSSILNDPKPKKKIKPIKIYRLIDENMHKWVNYYKTISDDQNESLKYYQILHKFLEKICTLLPINLNNNPNNNPKAKPNKGTYLDYLKFSQTSFYFLYCSKTIDLETFFNHILRFNILFIRQSPSELTEHLLSFNKYIWGYSVNKKSCSKSFKFVSWVQFQISLFNKLSKFEQAKELLAKTLNEIIDQESHLFRVQLISEKLHLLLSNSIFEESIEPMEELSMLINENLKGFKLNEIKTTIKSLERSKQLLSSIITSLNKKHNSDIPSKNFLLQTSKFFQIHSKIIKNGFKLSQKIKNPKIKNKNSKNNNKNSKIKNNQQKIKNNQQDDELKKFFHQISFSQFDSLYKAANSIFLISKWENENLDDTIKKTLKKLNKSIKRIESFPTIFNSEYKWVSITFFNFAIQLFNQNNLDHSIQFLLKSIELLNKMPQTFEVIELIKKRTQLISKCYSKLNQFKKAQKYLLKSIFLFSKENKKEKENEDGKKKTQNNKNNLNKDQDLIIDSFIKLKNKELLLNIKNGKIKEDNFIDLQSYSLTKIMEKYVPNDFSDQKLILIFENLYLSEQYHFKFIQSNKLLSRICLNTQFDIIIQLLNLFSSMESKINREKILLKKAYYLIEKSKLLMLLNFNKSDVEQNENEDQDQDENEDQDEDEEILTNLDHSISILLSLIKKSKKIENYCFDLIAKCYFWKAIYQFESNPKNTNIEINKKKNSNKKKKKKKSQNKKKNKNKGGKEENKSDNLQYIANLKYSLIYWAFCFNNTNTHTNNDDNNKKNKKNKMMMKSYSKIDLITTSNLLRMACSLFTLVQDFKWLLFSSRILLLLANKHGNKEYSLICLTRVELCSIFLEFGEQDLAIQILKQNTLEQLKHVPNQIRQYHYIWKAKCDLMKNKIEQSRKSAEKVLNFQKKKKNNNLINNKDRNGDQQKQKQKRNKDDLFLEAMSLLTISQINKKLGDFKNSISNGFRSLQILYYLLFGKQIEPNNEINYSKEIILMKMSIHTLNNTKRESNGDSDNGEGNFEFDNISTQGFMGSTYFTRNNWKLSFWFKKNLDHLGHIYQLKGLPLESKTYFKNSLKFVESLQFPNLISSSLINLLQLEFERGKLSNETLTVINKAKQFLIASKSKQKKFKEKKKENANELNLKFSPIYLFLIKVESEYYLKTKEYEKAKLILKNGLNFFKSGKLFNYPKLLKKELIKINFKNSKKILNCLKTNNFGTNIIPLKLITSLEIQYAKYLYQKEKFEKSQKLFQNLLDNINHLHNNKANYEEEEEEGDEESNDEESDEGEENDDSESKDDESDEKSFSESEKETNDEEETESVDDEESKDEESEEESYESKTEEEEENDDSESKDDESDGESFSESEEETDDEDESESVDNGKSEETDEETSDSKETEEGEEENSDSESKDDEEEEQSFSESEEETDNEQNDDEKEKSGSGNDLDELINKKKNQDFNISELEKAISYYYLAKIDLKKNKNEINLLWNEKQSKSTNKQQNLLDNLKQNLLKSFEILKELQYLPILMRKICLLLGTINGRQNPIETGYYLQNSFSITLRQQVFSLIDNNNSEQEGRGENQRENLYQRQQRQYVDFQKSDIQAWNKTNGHLPKQCSIISISLGADNKTILISKIESQKKPLNIQTQFKEGQVNRLVTEFENILAESKESMKETSKIKTERAKKLWWQTRKDLDQKIQQICFKIEKKVFKNFRSIFLGPIANKEKNEKFEKCLQQIYKNKDKSLDVNLEEMKLILRSQIYYTEQEMTELIKYFSPKISKLKLKQFLAQCKKIIRLTQLSKNSICYPTILILDRKIQKLPIESTPFLKDKTITRMPSLWFLKYQLIKRAQMKNQILDSDEAYYLLNPSGDLENTQSTFQNWFQSIKKWDGIIGKAPQMDSFKSALLSKDLFIYFGHGAGEKYLSSTQISKLKKSPTSILMGCSSGVLLEEGKFDPYGVVYSYLLAGSPAVVANLWDVTDRDIDRFSTSLLKNWLFCKKEHSKRVSLAELIPHARNTCLLKHLIGASPVYYGIPFWGIKKPLKIDLKSLKKKSIFKDLNIKSRNF
ncbi:separin [Anaeramoeba flamelloides]|uniref:separase n=1 Tax=Anaeramoeba flamelloides TaxID=1746091 RepID=A0ABQ8ZBM7_9EUKA|nr:separin [Anaeramoeba flamelloides]